MQLVEYDIHEAAKIFPPMSEHEFQQLKSDIQANGVRNDVVIVDGKLIDGRHRQRAMIELGIDPSYHSCELEECDDPIAYVVSLNLHRRHLTTTQRSMVAARLATLKRGQIGKGRKIDPSIDGSTSESCAALLAVSTASIERARKIIAEGSKELVAMVDSGELSLNKAVAVVTAHDKKSQASAAREKSPRKPKSEPTHISRARKLFESLSRDEAELVYSLWGEWIGIET